MKSFTEMQGKTKYVDELLYKGEWVELRRRNGFYEYLRERGDGVMVVIVDRINNRMLTRYENCPVHGDPMELMATSLTGGIEADSDMWKTAIKEVKEESGYDILQSQLNYHGYVYPTKSSDGRLHLFLCYLDGKADKERHIGKGDGTQGEVGAYCIWTDFNMAKFMHSPAVAMLLYRAGILELNLKW